MKRYFEFVGGTSAKFWEISTGGSEVSVRFGRIGTEGQTQVKRLATERLSLAIWRANGAYCDVTVRATYLEELPYETHCLDEADYARLIGGTQEKQHAHGSGR